MGLAINHLPSEVDFVTALLYSIIRERVADPPDFHIYMSIAEWVMLQNASSQSSNIVISVSPQW
jgi:hypothetical protein